MHTETENKTVLYIKKAETAVTLFTMLIFPIVFLGSFANVIETPKLVFLVSSMILLITLKSIRALLSNGIHFSSTSLDIPVFIIAVVYILSAVVKTPNKMEAFFLPGTATTIAAASIFFFIISQMHSEAKRQAKLTLFFSGVIYSLFVLFISAGLFKAIPQLPAFLQNTNFNTLGTSLPALIFLSIVAPFGIFSILKEKDIAKKVLYGVSICLIIFAFALNLLNVLPGKDTSPKLPSGQISWIVAVESLKNSPLFGVGPGNYLTAFNRYRPIEYNQTEMWATRFTSGRSFIFTLATETGIAGLAAFLLLLYYVYKLVKNREVTDSKIALTLAMTLLILFPTTNSLLVIFFIVAAIATHSRPGKLSLLNYDNTSNSRLPILLIVVPVLAGVFAISYYLQLIVRADVTYKNALDALAKNNGSQAYSDLQSAINLNPYVDRYRVSYAQINLAIANSLAAKKDLTDQDRNTIAQLIQQAIREGKVAVSLNPQRSSSWEILGSIYRAVAPLANGAGDFAVQTYTQAINYDPLNTNTRIALGGLYYSAGQYENAIDVFKLAVATKPDHANARYNLAVAYREAGQIQQAIDQMTIVLSLVDKNSDDFKVAQQALDDLQKRGKNAKQPESSTNLSAPEPKEQVLDQPIDLNGEAAPPKAPATDKTVSDDATLPEASASPAASIEPTATPTPAPVSK